MEQIKIHEKVETIYGFNFGYGYISWVYNGYRYATCGLTTTEEDGSYLYVSQLQADGWVSDWGVITDFSEVFITINNFSYEESRCRAIAEAQMLQSNNNLLITTEELIFPAEAISGDMNGYELYYVFTPTGNPGVYGVMLDCLETPSYKIVGMEIMFVALSVSDYDKYKAKS